MVSKYTHLTISCSDGQNIYVYIPVGTFRSDDM